MGMSVNSLVKNFPFVYLCDGKAEYDDYDVELDEVLKKLPNDIIEYYTNVIHDRDVKKENQDDKDRRLNYLEEEMKDVKDELYKFKCQMKYELSGWEGFCKFINIV